MAKQNHPTPPPKMPEHKMPEHLSTSKPAGTKETKIDKQMEDTFPASDPPSFSGGNHTVGAPPGRESETPGPDHPTVKKAEKKVKTGDVAKPDSY